MAASVLFDSPGPRTVARHRIYTVVTVLAIAGLLVVAVLRLNNAGQLEYEKWEPFLTPDYIRVLLVDGLLTTLQMAFFAVIFALVLGVLLGVGKLSDHRWLRLPCWAIVEFFRAVPVLLLMIFFFSVRGASDEFWCVVAALTLYNGAVLAEVFRAGVLAVPKGQAEAAYALGMGKTQVMTIILLPQAVKIMIPAIISQCIVALKDTSLGAAIAAPGLTAIGELISGQFRNLVPVTFVLAAMYVIVNLLLAALATVAQKKFVGEKKPLQVSMVGETDPGRTP